jgi:hypothetical protein
MEHLGVFISIGRIGAPRRGQSESVDKPGSVVDDHSSATNVTVRLKRPTRIRRGSRHRIPIWSCSERGLPSPRLLPIARCALTAPFHPYLRTGGFLSAALSVSSRPPGVTWRSDPLEPGLSSAAVRQRSPDRLVREPSDIQWRWQP